MENFNTPENMEIDDSASNDLTGDMEIIRLLEQIRREADLYISGQSISNTSEEEEQVQLEYVLPPTASLYESYVFPPSDQLETLEDVGNGYFSDLDEDNIKRRKKEEDHPIWNEDPCSMESDLKLLNDPEVDRLLSEIESEFVGNSQKAEEDPIPSTSLENIIPLSEEPGSLEMIDRRDIQDGGAKDGGYFSVRVKQVVERRKFRAEETIYEVKLNDQKSGLWKDNLALLGAALDNCLSRATENLEANDRVKFFINQRGLQTPISLPLKPIGEVSVANVLGSIEKVLQSKSSLKFDESFEFNVATVSLPKGGTGVRQSNSEKLKINKKCIIQILNKDKLCLTRAVSVAMAYKCNDDNKSSIINGRLKLQKDLALDLCLKAGISPDSDANLDDVVKIEQCLNIQTAVISGNHLNSVIYKGGDKVCKIYLYLENDHFHPVTNVKAFCSSKYYCEHCDVPYTKKENHRCKTICTSCYRTNCLNTQPKKCFNCNRTFRNESCFNRHKEVQRDAFDVISPSLCEKFWKCQNCNVILKTAERDVDDHVCGEMFCKLCKSYYKNEHRICYLKPKLAPKPSNDFIFFDFECTQETNEHLPNFVVAQKICSLCIHKETFGEEDKCKKCSKREIVYEGPDTVNEFCQWLFSDQHKNFTVIAHNARGYDSVFLLKYLLDNAIVPKVTFNGTKIMYLVVEQFNIKVIDSLNHIPTSLSNFPKTFGLTKLHKGYFPHFFNTSENQNYVGPFPNPSDYGYETMSVKSKENFLKWYSEQTGKIFNFRTEMLRYCKSDVDILRRSCLKFRELILEATTPPPSAIDDVEMWGVDPFKFVTMASLCFGIFRPYF